MGEGIRREFMSLILMSLCHADSSSTWRFRNAFPLSLNLKVNIIYSWVVLENGCFLLCHALNIFFPFMPADYLLRGQKREKNTWRSARSAGE